MPSDVASLMNPSPDIKGFERLSHRQGAQHLSVTLLQGLYGRMIAHVSAIFSFNSLIVIL
jgi:hypothetical protein